MPSTDLASALTSALSTGTPLTINLADVVTEANSNTVVSTTGVSVYTVNFSPSGLSLTSLSALDAILPGASMASCFGSAGSLFSEVLGGANILLNSVSFVLAPNGASLLQMSLDIGLATADNNPLSFPVGAQEVILSGVVINLDAPASGGGISGTLSGIVAFTSGLEVEVSIDLPEVVLSLDLSMGSTPSSPPLAAPVLLSDLLETMGFPASPTLLGSLIITDFEFSVDLSALTLLLAFEVEAPSPAGHFELEEATFSLDYDGTTFSAALSATIEVIGYLAVDVGFSVSIGAGTGTIVWDLSGALNLPQTLLNFPAPAPSALTLDLLLQQFGAQFTLPGDIGDVEITVLSFTGSYTDDSSSQLSYTFEIGIEIPWTLGPGQPSDSVTTDLTISQGGGATTLQLEATIEIDGFEFDVTWISQSSSTQVSMSMLNGELTGTYNTQDATLTISLTDAVSLGTLVSQFVGLFTDNPNVVLGAPWDVLNNINLSGATLTLTFGQTGVSGTATVQFSPAISLFTATITGLTLSRAAGQNPTVALTGTFPWGGPLQSWDPTVPGATQQLPGTGASVLDVKLLAAGQNISLSTPTTVTQAVQQLQSLVRGAGQSNVQQPAFSAASGWLIGADLLIEQQVSLQFVFADPSFYGAQVIVGSPPASGGVSYLQALRGLSAEIIYRKINETTGVYEGQLTLPASVSQIDFGSFQLHLPQLAATVYTDGEFDINVGYPTNGDFSHSASIVAGIYSGAGGVYFARLSGSNAPSLPTNLDPPGAFGTVTEFGFGLQLGVGYTFSSGPLSASLGVKLTGIFDGVFAEYTQSQQATPMQYEYYDVQASVSIVGTITGRVNFVVIQASVFVQLSLSADVTAIAGYPISVEIDASLEVSLTATLNLGFCKISKSFQFSYDLSYTAAFGSTQQLPWVTAGAGFVLAVPKAVESIADSFAPIPSFVQPLSVYVVPILTSTPAGWAEVIELALPVDYTNGGASTLYAQAVFTWFACAYSQAQGNLVSGTGSYPNLTMSAADVQQLQTLLQAMSNDEQVPSVEAVQAFFTNNLQLSVAPLPNQGETVAISAFPALPGMTVTATAMSGQQPLQAVTTTPDLATQQGLVRDHLVLTALGYISILLPLMESAGETWSLEQMFSQVGSGVSQVDGTVTRFMLHGTCITGSEPLYTATGQQVGIEFSQFPQLTGITFTLQGGGDYGLTPDPYALPSAPLPMTGYIQQPYTTATVTSEVSDFVSSVQRQMPLKPGANVTLSNSGAGAVLPLSRDMLQLLDSEGAVTATLLDENGDPVSSADYAWSSELSFAVRQWSPPTGAASPPPIYVIGNLSSDSVSRLAQIYPQLAQSNAPSFTVELLWPTGSGATVALAGVMADGSSAFVYQRNLSTQSAPEVFDVVRPSVSSAPGALTFLGQLLASALTHRGGFYLYVDGGIPDTAFDAQGGARLTVLVNFSASTSIAPYISAVRTGAAYPAGTALSVSSPQATTLQPLMPLGLVGLNVERSTPTTSDTDYSATLDDLYNLVGFIPALTRAKNKEVGKPVDVPLVASPVAASGSQWIYSQIYDLFTRSKSSILPLFRDASALTRLPGVIALLEPSSDPYQFVGDTLSAPWQFMDLFGNGYSVGASPLETVIPWTEQLSTLANWPGLSVGYVVERELLGLGPRVLRLKLSWNPPAKGVSSQRVAYGMQYARLYHQLAYADVQVSTSLVAEPLTSLAGLGALISPATALRERIAIILAALELGDEWALPLPELTFSMPWEDAEYSSEVLYQLVTNLEFTLRPGTPVPAGYSLDDFASTQALAPAHDTSKGNAALSFRAFAQALEGALSALDVKLMAGETDDEPTPNFWIFRYGKSGLEFSASLPTDISPIGYAPRPLGAQLMSRSGIDASSLNDEIQALCQSNPLQVSGSPSVTGFDVDLAMQQFMTTLEAVLAPGSGIQAALVNCDDDTPVVDVLMTAKQTLAQTLAQYVESLSNQEAFPEDSGLPIAQAGYQQAMLKSATSFYGVDAMATYQLSISVKGDLAPGTYNVFGHLVDSQGLTAGITISPVSCQIDTTEGSGIFSVGVSAQQKGVIDAYTLPNTFRVEAIEVALSTVDIDITGQGDLAAYTLGTWLHFIIPPTTNVSCPVQQVSFPLRTQPTTPTLVAQGFQPATSVPGSDPLEQAKGWTLTAEYQHHYVAQDTVYATFVVNPPEQTNFAALDTSPDLLDALALYQALSPQLTSGLATLNGGFAVSPDTQSAQALLAFAAAAKLVSTCAATLPLPSQFSLESAPTQYSFAVTEGPEDTSQLLTSRWLAVVQSDPGSGVSSENLMVQILGYTTERVKSDGTTTVYCFRDAQGRLLTEAQAALISDRSISFVDFLTIIGMQSAQAYLLVQRNRYTSLESSEQFPASFQLTSPQVTFTSAVQPFLSISGAVNLTQLQNAEDATTLTTFLESFFMELMSAAQGTQGAGVIPQLSAWLAMPLQTRTAPSQLTPVSMVPITLLPCSSTVLALNATLDQVQPLCTAIAMAIGTWITNTGRPTSFSDPLWADASFVFQVAAYPSTGSGTGVPLLVLDEVTLPANVLQGI